MPDSKSRINRLALALAAMALLAGCAAEGPDGLGGPGATTTIMRPAPTGR